MTAIFVALLGCGASQTGNAAPTWHADIAPIVADSCLPCHGDDGASELPLTTWEEARDAAPAAMAAVESGRMPAGNIDRSGECGSFVGPAPLRDEDVDLLLRWVDEGTLEGQPVDLPPAAAPPPFSPDLGFDFGPFDDTEGEHRCLLVEGGAGAAFLRALSVEVSAPGAVHHLMLFSLPSASDEAAARALDAASEDVGWDCDGPTGVPGAELATAWTPGAAIVAFPDGTGLLLPGGPMVVQLHLGTPESRAGAVARLELELAGTVDRALALHPVAATGFALPPGLPSVTWTETEPLAAPDLEVYGVFPHMHAQGRALNLRAPDTCLVEVPRWDYQWQELAFYVEPIALSSGTPLELSCTFSTLDAEGTTVWGEHATDEMCMVFLLGG